MSEFWNDLRRADLLFERDRLPPTAWICDGRYYFADRRGDRHRHAVHLPGCKRLDEPVSAREAAQRLEFNKRAIPALGENSEKAVETEAKTCDLKSLRCRLLRVALDSPVICPKKYARCRTPKAALTKSVDCPLKYPRCRWFVGPDPKMRSASRKNQVIPVKR